MDNALKAAIDNADDGLTDYLKEQSNDAFNSGDQGSAIILRAWAEAIPIIITALRSFTSPEMVAMVEGLTTARDDTHVSPTSGGTWRVSILFATYREADKLRKAALALGRSLPEGK